MGDKKPGRGPKKKLEKKTTAAMTEFAKEIAPKSSTK
jgi:hypothetical protein